MALFFKRSKSKRLKVFYIYVIYFACLIFFQLLLKYYFRSREIYFLSIRINHVVEFCLLAYFLQSSFYNLTVRKILKATFPLYLIYSIYNYIISDKITFGADPAIVESLLMISILIYFFFEKIKYEIQTPLYESKIFWIAVALFIYFSGNFFLLIYSKTMINDLNFRNQYVIIYNTFNIIKNLLLCVALMMKPDNNKKGTVPGQPDFPFESFLPY